MLVRFFHSTLKVDLLMSRVKAFSFGKACPLQGPTKFFIAYKRVISVSIAYKAQGTVFNMKSRLCFMIHNWFIQALSLSFASFFLLFILSLFSFFFFFSLFFLVFFLFLPTKVGPCLQAALARLQALSGPDIDTK